MGKFRTDKISKRQQKPKKSKATNADSESDSSSDSDSSSSGDESSQVGLTSSKQAQEIALALPYRHADGRARGDRCTNLSQVITKQNGATHQDASGRGSIQDFDSKPAKKLRKAEEKLRDEAINILMERELGPSITSSGIHLEAEAQRKKQKKLEKRREKRAELAAKDEAKANDLAAQAEAPTGEDGDIFMFDLNPTPVDPKKLEEPSEHASAKPTYGTKGLHPPPSGINRLARRRLKLIEVERAAIQKKLGVAVGSDEKADEVQTRLDEWIKTNDEKTQLRQQRLKARKDKTTARLQKRGGRLLEGLKEKQGSRNKKKVQTISRN